jgi:hypothetical protein
MNIYSGFAIPAFGLHVTIGHCGGIKWHNVHTKFNGNLSTGSNVEVRDTQTQHGAIMNLTQVNVS